MNALIVVAAKISGHIREGDLVRVAIKGGTTVHVQCRLLHGKGLQYQYSVPFILRPPMGLR